MTKEINVGDKVRVLPGAASDFSPGEIVMVLETDFTTLPYYCENESGDQREWMHAHEVELASSSLEHRVAALESELAELKASMWAATAPVAIPNLTSAAPVARFYSADELRKEAIAIAKESVASSYFTSRDKRSLVSTLLYGDVTVHFVTNKEKRTVVAILRLAHTTQRSICAKGIAKCDPTDVFNEDIGKAIALDRALKRVTDVRILRAPNPEEIVAGMVVEPKPISGLIGGAYTAVTVDECGDVHDLPGYGWGHKSELNIVEDTDAKY
jgi:hypothetical protein